METEYDREPNEEEQSCCASARIRRQRRAEFYGVGGWLHTSGSEPVYRCLLPSRVSHDASRSIRGSLRNGFAMCILCLLVPFIVDRGILRREVEQQNIGL